MAQIVKKLQFESPFNPERIFTFTVDAAGRFGVTFSWVDGPHSASIERRNLEDLCRHVEQKGPVNGRGVLVEKSGPEMITIRYGITSNAIAVFDCSLGNGGGMTFPFDLETLLEVGSLLRWSPPFPLDGQPLDAPLFGLS